MTDDASCDVLSLTPEQRECATELFDQLREVLGGQDFQVMASVIANLMAAFACACRIEGRVDPEANLDVLLFTARHLVELRRPGRPN